MDTSPHFHSPRSVEAKPVASSHLDPLDGMFPPRNPNPTRSVIAAVLARDGVLRVGEFTLSLDGMMRHLNAFAKITSRIATTFPTQDDLVKVLPDAEIPILPAALDFTEAFNTFKAVQARQIVDVDFIRASRKLDSLREGEGLSTGELEAIRHLLMTGARLATVCAGVDAAMGRALEYRSPLQRGKDWVFDRAGSVRLSDSRIQSRLMPMPFEEYHVHSRRIEADLMAQRIGLRNDGSASVRIVGGAERQAAEVLSRGTLARSIRLSQGSVEGDLVVYARDGEGMPGGALYSEAHRIEDVFSAMKLGQAASRFLESMRRDRIDLVRLSQFIDRSVAMGLKACLEALPPQVHTRLSDVDEWAPLFDTQRSRPLSDDERGDLGTLLLDAEICLLVAGHLQCVTQAPGSRDLWRKLWAAALRDREVKAAQMLVNIPPAPLECDCSGAAGVAGSAAMLLGYHAEDRVGAAWRVPENPVVSLTWALNR